MPTTPQACSARTLSTAIRPVATACTTTSSQPTATYQSSCAAQAANRIVLQYATSSAAGAPIARGTIVPPSTSRKSAVATEPDHQVPTTTLTSASTRTTSPGTSRTPARSRLS